MASTSVDTPAQLALARLVADQKRPGGVTDWCDRHRPDIELVVRELGVPTLAQAVGMQQQTLYAWAARRNIPPANLRAGPRAPPAPTPTPAVGADGSPPTPAPAPPRRKRRTDTVAQPDGTARPQPESSDYWRGLAEGLMWAIEHLAPRP